MCIDCTKNTVWINRISCNFCSKEDKEEKLSVYQRSSNVAIANALQLVAARATPALCSFNYDAMPSLLSLNLSIAVL